METAARLHLFIVLWNTALTREWGRRQCEVLVLGGPPGHFVLIARTSLPAPGSYTPEELLSLTKQTFNNKQPALPSSTLLQMHTHLLYTLLPEFGPSLISL